MEKYYIQIYRILLFNSMLKRKNIIKYSPYSLEKSQKIKTEMKKTPLSKKEKNIDKKEPSIKKPEKQDIKKDKK